MRRYHVTAGGRQHVIDVHEVTAHEFHVIVEGHEIDVRLSDAEDVPESAVTPEIGLRRVAAGSDGNGNGNGHGAAPPAVPSAARFRPVAPETLPAMVPAAPPPLPPAADGRSRGAVKAPMPGTIVSVDVKGGDGVETGQVLLKLEAMKMVNAIRAPHDGVVSEVRVQRGESVGYGHVLVTFREA
jgi:biotin carboxyl carrier protein